MAINFKVKIWKNEQTTKKSCVSPLSTQKPAF